MERGLIGLEARTAEGAEAGRITELIEDEESGEVTHAVIERDEERFEIPIASLSLDPEASPSLTPTPPTTSPATTPATTWSPRARPRCSPTWRTTATRVS